MAYDILISPGRAEAQVKLWECEYNTYKVGDHVPVGPNGEDTYLIACRGGGFFFVGGGELVCWVPTTRKFYEQFPIYDKYGDIYQPGIYGGESDPFSPANLMTHKDSNPSLEDN